jgi:ATP-binding cassette subfamily F protein 3
VYSFTFSPNGFFPRQDGQERLAAVYEGLENIEADSAERRADELLVNLGFSDELRARPLEALSGGWRVRTMLAAAVFARPDLLLLDEPTNHLSITAVMWLARELATSPVRRFKETKKGCKDLKLKCFKLQNCNYGV